MATQNVETVTSMADRAKIVLAIGAVVLGIVGFYMLASHPTVARITSILIGFVAGGLIAWTSTPGRRLFGFGQDAWSEARRVVWPTRKETTQMTLIVFVFVVIMALFLWAVDQSLSWILYDLLLGWK